MVKTDLHGVALVLAGFGIANHSRKTDVSGNGSHLGSPKLPENTRAENTEFVPSLVF